MTVAGISSICSSLFQVPYSTELPLRVGVICAAETHQLYLMCLWNMYEPHPYKTQCYMCMHIAIVLLLQCLIFYQGLAQLCICSVQSENLYNLEIALRSLRIPRLRTIVVQSWDCTTIVRNLLHTCKNPHVVTRSRETTKRWRLCVYCIS